MVLLLNILTLIKTNKNNPKPIKITSLIPAFSTFLLLKSIKKYQLIFQHIKYINSIQPAVIFFSGKEITGKLFSYIIFIPFSNVTLRRSWRRDLLPQASGYRFSIFPMSVFTKVLCFFWIQLAVAVPCCMAASLMEEKPGGGGADIVTEPEFGDPPT